MTVYENVPINILNKSEYLRLSLFKYKKSLYNNKMRLRCSKETPMEAKTILFADDDPEIREVLRLLLTGKGHRTLEAANGTEALEKLDDTVDLLILDVMMPGMSGYAVCSEIRRRSAVPVLFLTSKSQYKEKSVGFSAGGDDYLVKPFSYTELVSRVKAMLRRYCVYGAKSVERSSGVIRCCGDIEINTAQNTVCRNGREVSLTDTEYRILLLLASHQKTVFSVQSIYESIWKEPYFYTSNNTVMVHIRNIRRKLGDDPQNSRTIRTVWGKGYRIE